MPSRLSQEEVREILARAEEIHLRRGAADAPLGDTEFVIRAAEEAGLSRAAVEEALRERFNLLAAPPEPGELVFAKSTEQFFSVAEVLQTDANRTRVRFLNGLEQTVNFEHLRPLSLGPGARILCPWPNWGWWTCTVISYDSKKQKVKVTDGWGTTKSFNIAEIALESPKRKGAGLLERSKALLYCLIAAGGGLIGAVATWLAMR